jgi:hypothetical protein
MKTFIVFALMGALLAGSILPANSATLLPNDDVYVETSSDGTITSTYDAHIFSSQVAFGLGAANGVASGRRRSYLEFTLGSETVSSAKLMLYNYWGAAMGDGSNPAASGQIRLRGAAVATPVEFSEPASSLVTDFVPPLEASFGTILTTGAGAITNVGWYEFDITSWYNARLGQTTSLMLRGTQTGGFDFPLFEDRENSAFLNGSENSLINSGPRIEFVVVPEPATLALLPLGGLLLYLGRRHKRRTA